MTPDAKIIRLFKFDGSELAAVSDAGVAKLLTYDGIWEPVGGSRAMALEVLGDERAFELNDVEAAAALAAREADWPEWP